MNEREIEELMRLAQEAPEEGAASSRLRSRIYSALMLAEAAEGPLRSLGESESCGGELCIFEKLVEISPVDETLQSYNYCRICHGRVMGEQIENPPLYWPGCPYAQFKNT
jgi:hypothetical protein